MQGIKKQFDLINNEWVEVNYPSNTGYFVAGSDGINRRMIMSGFTPDFPGKCFNFDFQVWVEVAGKTGVPSWTFKENFSLKADKKTWLNLTTYAEYLERLPASDPESAWNEVDDLDHPYLDENGQPTGTYLKKLELKTECEVTNFDFWHTQIFGTVEPVIAGSIIKRQYCEMTSV